MIKDPDAAEVTILDSVVIKRHRTRNRFTDELIGYANCYWAAPKLFHVDVENMVLCIERCVPLYEVPKDPRHAEQARELLAKLHYSGWNHCDCSLLNMVLHPERGILLIDWETVWKVPGDPRDSLSYDLFGAHKSKYPPQNVPKLQQPEGVWWGSKRLFDPVVYWGTM